MFICYINTHKKLIKVGFFIYIGTMIKQTMPKPIVFDKNSFFKNLHNWVLVKNDFNGLDYSNDEGSCYHEFQLLWSVNGEEISTWVELTHRWVEYLDKGDYWTPSSSEIIHEDIEVYVTQMWDSEGNEYNLDESVYDDLCHRLSFLIHDTLFFGF